MLFTTCSYLPPFESVHISLSTFQCSFIKMCYYFRLFFLMITLRELGRGDALLRLEKHIAKDISPCFSQARLGG